MLKYEKLTSSNSTKSGCSLKFCTNSGKQECIKSNANHLLAESMGHIKFEEM